MVHSVLSAALTMFLFLSSAVYGPPRQNQLSSLGPQFYQGLRSLPQRLIFVLRVIFATVVWGFAFPLLLAEVWNYVLGVESFPLYLDEGVLTWMPFSLNPVRLVASGFKGVCITGGLFIASALIFLMVEHIEAFLDHVAFIRQHRERQRGGAMPEEDDAPHEAPQEPAPQEEELWEVWPDQVPYDQPERVVEPIADQHHLSSEEKEEAQAQTDEDSIIVEITKTPRGIDLKPVWIRLSTDVWLAEQPKLLDLDAVLTHRKMLLYLAEDDHMRPLSVELHRYFEWRNEHNISTMGRLYNEKMIASYWYAHYATFINQEALRKYADETSIKRRFYDHFSLLAFRMVHGSPHAWDDSEDDMQLSDSSTMEASKQASQNLSPRDFGPSLSEDEDELHVPADDYDEQSSEDPLKSVIVDEDEDNDVTRFKALNGPFALPEDAAEASAIAVIALLVHKILANKQIHAYRARRIHGEDAASSSSPASSPRGLAMVEEERKIWNLVDEFSKRSASYTSEETALTKQLEEALVSSGGMRMFDLTPDMSGSSSAPPSARSQPVSARWWASASANDEDSSLLSAQDSSPSSTQNSSPQVDHIESSPKDPEVEILATEAVVENEVEPDVPAPAVEEPLPIEVVAEIPNPLVNIPEIPAAAPAAIPAPQVDEELDRMFDDEDVADHRQHWMILIFGRRRPEAEEPVAEQANDDNGISDVLGITGNPLWSLFILFFLLLLSAIAVVLLVLVPQVTGKILHRASLAFEAVIEAQNGPNASSVLSAVIAATQSCYGLILPFVTLFQDNIHPYLEPYLNHPMMPILLHPTAIGFYVCIAIILTFCAKRSPLAISARSFVAYFGEMFFFPILIGTFTLQILHPVLQLDDPLTRPPILSRYRASKVGATTIGSSSPVNVIMETIAAPWQQDPLAQPLLLQVNDTLSHLLVEGSNYSTPNASAFNSSGAGFSLTNATIATAAVTANVTSSSVAKAFSPEFANLIVQVAEQVESVFAYSLTHYAGVFVQLVVGYLVIVSWVWALGTLRRTLKRDILRFLPGDPNFSQFLTIANATMRQLMILETLGAFLLMLAIAVFLGLPFYIIRNLNNYYNWRLFRVVVPSSSFQIFTDYNMAFTLLPIIIMLIKPLKSIPALLSSISKWAAMKAGAEDVMLIGFPREAPRPPAAAPVAAPEAAPEAGGAPAAHLPNPAPVDPPAPPQLSLFEARIRIGIATVLGCALLTGFIFGAILLPWAVGSFFVRIWIYDTDYLPMYTGTVGLFFLTVMTRIFMVYANIWRLHYASRAAIGDNDNGAREALRRTTFDNGFRATVIILAVFVCIPIVLGYLIRIVFFYAVLPPHVLVPLNSPLEGYVVGIMGMQILNVFSRLPLPWLLPIRAILDTVSFETILQVDYAAFLNQVVYPLSTLVLVLGGVPSVANTLLAFFGTDIADDVLANMKRKMYALLPLGIFALVMLYFAVMSFARTIDQIFNGKVIISRQIHNFNPEVPAGQAPTALRPEEVLPLAEPAVAAPEEPIVADEIHPVLDDPIEN